MLPSAGETARRGLRGEAVTFAQAPRRGFNTAVMVSRLCLLVLAVVALLYSGGESSGVVLFVLAVVEDLGIRTVDTCNECYVLVHC